MRKYHQLGVPSSMLAHWEGAGGSSNMGGRGGGGGWRGGKERRGEEGEGKQEEEGKEKELLLVADGLHFLRSC